TRTTLTGTNSPAAARASTSGSGGLSPPAYCPSLAAAGRGPVRSTTARQDAAAGETCRMIPPGGDPPLTSLGSLSAAGYVSIYIHRFLTGECSFSTGSPEGSERERAGTASPAEACGNRTHPATLSGRRSRI